MAFTFKLSKRLASCYAEVVCAAAEWACAADHNIVGFTPDSAYNQPRPVASVTITPPADSGVVGRRVQFTAVPKDSANAPLTGRAVTWSSGDTTVVTIAADGMAVVVGVGSAYVEARVDGRSGQAAVVSVRTPVGVVLVTPAVVTVRGGDTVRLSAMSSPSRASPWRASR